MKFFFSFLFFIAVSLSTPHFSYAITCHDILNTQTASTWVQKFKDSLITKPMAKRRLYKNVIAVISNQKIPTENDLENLTFLLKKFPPQEVLEHLVKSYSEKGRYYKEKYLSITQVKDYFEVLMFAKKYSKKEFDILLTYLETLYSYLNLSPTFPTDTENLNVQDTIQHILTQIKLAKTPTKKLSSTALLNTLSDTFIEKLPLSSNGLSFDEFQKTIALSKNFKSIQSTLQSSAIGIGVSKSVLLNIFKNGSIKNVYELDNPYKRLYSGIQELKARSESEARSLNMDLKTYLTSVQPENRPIYGFLHPNLESNLASAQFQKEFSGDFTLVLKNTPELKNQSTFTFGDLFNRSIYSMTHFLPEYKHLVMSEDNKLKSLSPYPVYWDEYLIPMSYLDITIPYLWKNIQIKKSLTLSAGNLAQSTRDLWPELRLRINNSGFADYIEVQIFTPITIDLIEAITFSKSPPSKDIVDFASQNNIKIYDNRNPHVYALWSP